MIYATVGVDTPCKRLHLFDMDGNVVNVPDMGPFDLNTVKRATDVGGVERVLRDTMFVFTVIARLPSGWGVFRYPEIVKPGEREDERPRVDVPVLPTYDAALAFFHMVSRSTHLLQSRNK